MKRADSRWRSACSSRSRRVALAADETTTRATRSSTPPRSGTCTSGSRSTSGRSTSRSRRRSPTCSSGRSCRCLLGIVADAREDAARIPTASRRSARSSTRSRRCRSPSRACPHKAMRTLVPVLREPDDLHLGREHARLHPAAALGREGRHRRRRAARRSAIFAATSTLSVTLALALMTWVFTHVEGIRANGVLQVPARAGSPTSRRRSTR